MALVKIYSKGTGGGGGGNAVILTGSGALSSQRCGANNSAQSCATTALGQCNQAKNNFSAVFGGQKSLAAGNYAAIVGGGSNQANGCFSLVGNGLQNITSTNLYATILNGKANNICGNFGTIVNGQGHEASVGSLYGFIGNGYFNKVENTRSSVVNGFRNRATQESFIAQGCYNTAFGFLGFLGNGCSNVICASSECSAILNGYKNCIVGSSTASTITNGLCNTIANQYSFIGGGDNNQICGDPTGRNAIVMGSVNRIVGTCYSSDDFIAAGVANTICEGQKSSIFNGLYNYMGAYSKYATITNGKYNAMCCSNFSVLNGQANTIVTSCFSSINGVNNCLLLSPLSTILSGCSNYAGSSDHSIMNGQNNTLTQSNQSFINGNNNNIANSSFSAILNSSYSIIDDNAAYSLIASGKVNSVCTGSYGAILAGYGNCTTSSVYSFIGNGRLNKNFKDFATIVNGQENCAGGVKAAILNGECNYAVADFSTVLNGLCVCASAAYTTAWGVGAFANRRGQISNSSFQFGGTGSSQAIELTLANSTTGNTPKLLYLDGTAATGLFTLLSGSVVNCFVEVIGVRSDGGRYGSKTEYVTISNNAGTTSIVYQNTIASHFSSGSWNIVIQANNTTDSLDILCNGDIGEKVKWFATIWGVELFF